MVSHASKRGASKHADNQEQPNGPARRSPSRGIAPGTAAARLLEVQQSAGNHAAGVLVKHSAHATVQRDEDADLAGQETVPGPAYQTQDGGAEELQSAPHPRTQAEARALVDAHVSPKDCFIELESTRAGWRPISGTGCAHWVSHQRGGPTGTTHSCQQNFKYRVTELLATLTRASADLQGAVVGAVWSASGSSHVGIVRAVTRDPTSNAVASVQVENDSSASGGVVTQTKTDGSIYT